MQPTVTQTHTAPGLLTGPDGEVVEEFVLASPDVEQAEPDLPVMVYARRGHGTFALRTVDAGRVALYDKAIHHDQDPSTWSEDERGLAWCIYCGVEMDGQGPGGDEYPVPDSDDTAGLVCPAHPRTDRPRPHAGVYFLVNITTMRAILPGEAMDNRRRGERDEALRVRAEQAAIGWHSPPVRPW